MIDDETKAIEAKMRVAVQQRIAEERNTLDKVDLATRTQITNILGYSDFGTDGWLISPCSYLGGKRPLDLLEADTHKAISAAIHTASWVTSG